MRELNLPDAPPSGDRARSAPRRILRRRLAPGHIVMIAAGVLAFVLTFASLRDRAEQIEVVVAGNGMEVGMPFEMSMVETTLVPAVAGTSSLGLVTLSAAQSAAAEGAFVLRAVPAGVLLRNGDVANEPAERHRAMALSIDRTRAMDGALQPGDIIDVITVEGGMARLALVGVPVLAVSGDRAGSGRTVILTLEVDIATSLRLAHAMAVGNVQVVRATGAPPARADLTYPAAPTEVFGG